MTDRNGDKDNEEIMIRRDGNDCSMNSTTDNNTLFFTPIIIIIIMMMMTQKSPPPPVIRRSLHPCCCSLETGGQPVILILTLVPEYSQYSCRWSGSWLIDWFVVDAVSTTPPPRLFGPVDGLKPLNWLKNTSHQHISASMKPWWKMIPEKKKKIRIIIVAD